MVKQYEVFSDVTRLKNVTILTFHMFNMNEQTFNGFYDNL